MKLYTYKNNARGFTLIEVMISAGLFVVVMTMGIGAVLAVNTTHKKTLEQRNVIDNLSFVMEDMSRNLAIGSNYRCPAGVTLNTANQDGSYSASLDLDQSPLDCFSPNEASAISFTPFTANDPDERQVYIFVRNNPNDPASKGRMYKSADNGLTLNPMTSAEIELDPVRTGFTVTGTGTELLANDTRQPRVTIRLSGIAKFKDIESPFDLQTTVSQRLIDAE